MEAAMHLQSAPENLVLLRVLWCFVYVFNDVQQALP